MKTSYTEFDIETGIIRRVGFCDSRFVPIPRSNCGIVLDERNAYKEKIECDGIDENGIAINPVVCSHNRERPEREVPEDEKRASITVGQLNNILHRIEVLERRINP